MEGEALRVLEERCIPVFCEDESWLLYRSREFDAIDFFVFAREE